MLHHTLTISSSINHRPCFIIYRLDLPWFSPKFFSLIFYWKLVGFDKSFSVSLKMNITALRNRMLKLKAGATLLIEIIIILKNLINKNID
jgi:hypothetical protein